MPDTNIYTAELRKAEAIVGQMNREELTIYLCDCYPDAPLKDVMEAAREYCHG